MSTAEDKARAPRKRVDLPWGVLIDGEIHEYLILRELLHDEEDLIGTQESRDNEDLLAECIIQIGDSITDRTRIEAAVPYMMKGDYDWALIQLRILSLKSLYEFSWICRNKDCGEQNDEEIDLDEIEVVEALDRAKRTFVYTSEDGVKAEFNYLRVKDTGVISEALESGERVLAKILANQLVSIEGQEPEGKTNAKRIREGIKLLNKHMPRYYDREECRKLLFGVKGGPDRVVISKCGKCPAKIRQKMPINPTFLLPSMAAEGIGADLL